MSFAPVFTSLLGPLDEASKGLILHLLLADVPSSHAEQMDYFEPYYGKLPKKDVNWLKGIANNMKRTLIYRNGVMPLGLLAFCLDYSRTGEPAVGGVFQSVRDRFSKISDPGLYKLVDSLKNFRNTCVAHQDKEILDKDAAKSALKEWIDGLIKIYKSHHK